METNVVLQGIAKYSSPSDLKTYREVNSIWNSIMTPEQYRKGTVTFKTISKLLTYTIEKSAPAAFRHRNFDIRIPLTREIGRGQIAPAKLFSFFEKLSEEIQHLKILLLLNANREENLGAWLGLFENLGHLKTLELDVDFYDLFLIQVDLNFVNTLPVLLSLNKLKFGICYDHQEYNAGFITRLLAIWGNIIVSMGPNLRSLAVKKILFGRTDYTGRFHRELMIPLAVVPKRVPNLQEFQILAKEGTPREMLKLPGGIRKLKLVWSPTESQGLQNWIDLNDLLEKNARSLEEITLSLKPEVNKETNPQIYIGLRFPLKMPRLKRFHLQLIPQMELDPGRKIQFPFGLVDYATICPLLDELMLDVSSYKSVTDDMLSPNLAVCENMKKITVDLKFFQWHNSFNGPFEEGLKRRFPNANIHKISDCRGVIQEKFVI